MFRKLLIAAMATVSVGILPGTAFAQTPETPQPDYYRVDPPIVAPLPPEALGLRKPEFANYLVCLDDAIYVDFTDPDGGDDRLRVTMRVNRPDIGWTTHKMINSGQTNHGVFFWFPIREHGIDRRTVTEYEFIAEKSVTAFTIVRADGDCVVR